MWTIRKTKRASQATLQGEVVEPPHDAVPRFVARQMLMLLRMAHVAGDNMNNIYPKLSPDQKLLYEPFANIAIRPSFYDVMKLIDVSEERGFLSPDEAASLRAGRVVGIDNPIPDVERNGDEGRA